MKRIERISLARILSDLVKSDFVLDKREIDLFYYYVNLFRIKTEDLQDAKCLSFAEAVSYLQDSSINKNKIFEIFRQITEIDKYCNSSEALLLLALYFSLIGNDNYKGYMVSIVDSPLLEGQLVYLESEYDKNINIEIADNFFHIEKMVRQMGLEMVFIPKVSDSYSKLDNSFLEKVVPFINPDLTREQTQHTVEAIIKLKTKDFFNVLIYKKFKMIRNMDLPPSLLLKVGNSSVKGKLYSDYLILEINNSILGTVTDMHQKYMSFSHSEYSIVRNNNYSNPVILYSGIFKQIMDLYTSNNCSKSRIVIDTNKGKILFADIHKDIESIPRAAKALYVFVLMESITGGVSFNAPENRSQLRLYNQRVKRQRQKYSAIYRLFNGDVEQTPDIEDPMIRNPLMSKINRCVSALSQDLTNIEEYQIHRNVNGCYSIGIDKGYVFCMEKTIIPWMQSNKWRNIFSI